METIQPCLVVGEKARIDVSAGASAGYIGEYLCRIQKETMVQFHHYPNSRYSAQHTLKVCRAWAEERRVLTLKIEADLLFPSVVRGTLRNDEKWETGEFSYRRRPMRGSVGEKCSRQMSFERGRGRTRAGWQRARLGFALAMPPCHCLATEKVFERRFPGRPLLGEKDPDMSIHL